MLYKLIVMSERIKEMNMLIITVTEEFFNNNYYYYTFGKYE